MKNLFKQYPKLTMLAVNIVLIFLLLLLAEVYLRFTQKKPDVIVENDGIHRAISLREGRPFLSAHYIPGDYWHEITDNLEFKTYRTDYDENGFLKPAKVHEQPDREIYFLGGSTTHCEYVDADKRFPALAAKLISEQTGLKVNGYNGGFSFNNSLHSINTLFNKILPQKPHTVVMMHAINDVFTLATYESYWRPDSRNVGNLVEIPSSPTGVRAIAKGLRDVLFPNLYNAVRSTLRKSSQPAGNAPLIEEKNLGANFKGEAFYVEKFEQNLRLFIAICREAGIKPVLMTQANRLKENPDPAVKSYIGFLQGLGQVAAPNDVNHFLPLTYAQLAALEHAFNEANRRVGAQQNVLVIDLEKEIPQEKEFMYDAVHLTEKGSLEAAGIIARALAPLVVER